MKQKNWLLSLSICSFVMASCTDHDLPPVQEKPATFKEVSAVDLGGESASEISAYDPISQRLFVVNNESAAKVDVFSLTVFPVVVKLLPIELSSLGGVANSVAVHNGVLAIALEATIKQNNGSVIVVNTSTLAQIKQITVGALPDMVTFSPDGKYIVTANEGEPSVDYTNDPVGTVSIIDVQSNYSVKTLDFSPFEGSKTQLATGGFRVYGLNATVAKDVEPEYVAISADSKKAWALCRKTTGLPKSTWLRVPFCASCRSVRRILACLAMPSIRPTRAIPSAYRPGP
ncbi:MAG: hypothetical protein LH606_08730 [Cytophagaceae bacterium]|nr:hypothetical protein [Cytophagaceae bacterium]